MQIGVLTYNNFYFMNAFKNHEIKVTITLTFDPKLKGIYTYANNPRSVEFGEDKQLRKFDGQCGNYTGTIEPTPEIITKMAARVIANHGPITKYQYWYHEGIKQWRLVFGN